MKRFLSGDEALAEGVRLARPQVISAYPITPQTEVAAYMAKRMPKEGGTYLQAESEIAAINMVYGVAATGKRAMTSSSSPGIALKCEGISYLAGADLPAVIVNVQRGGPGLGGIQPSQSDYFLATRGPGHGDFHVLVLAPASVQEMADLTGKAFDLAEKYRMPAMLLADGTMGQMMEPVQLPEARDPDTTEKDWAVTGTKCQRKHHVVNSLYLSPAELERLNIERFERYAEIEKNECMWEAFMMEDAEVCIVSCGITARVSRNAIVEARKQGIKAGMIRPITLWPFPVDAIEGCMGCGKAADQVKRFVCVELNMGQMREDVQLAVECKKPVDLCFRVGGMIPSPDEVLDAIRKANEGGND